MNRTSRFRRPLLVALTALASGAALGDDYHYNNMLIGDRASGMGGAYTAISDDATGLFYNPAGIIYTRGSNISASVNAYHVTNLAYKSVLGGDDWTRESSSLLPNFFGVVQPLGRGVVGFSYAVTDSIQENLDQRFALPNVNDFVINLNNSDSTYKLGPSYAVELNKNLSVGVTLYGHLRNTETVMNQVITGIAPGGTDEWQNRYSQSSEFGFEPIVGIMWTPADKISIGASLRQITIVDSELKNQSTIATTANPSPVTVIQEFSNERAYPMQIALGAAYFPTDRLLISGDFTYYTEANGDQDESASGPFRTKSATWNASAGMEYYMSSAWALRGGLFTNNANTPTVKTGGINQPEHVNMIGVSASVSRFTRNSSISAGFSYATGEGDAQIVGGVDDVQTLAISTTTFFLSTSYTY